VVTAITVTAIITVIPITAITVIAITAITAITVIAIIAVLASAARVATTLWATVFIRVNIDGVGVGVGVGGGRVVVAAGSIAGCPVIGRAVGGHRTGEVELGPSLLLRCSLVGFGAYDQIDNLRLAHAGSDLVAHRLSNDGQLGTILAFKGAAIGSHG
jgi:hypothetical protein